MVADPVLTVRHSEDWEAAYDMSRSLSRDCAELRVWDRVAKFALESALVSHTKLEKPRNGEWAYLALAYLSVCAVTGPDDDLEQLETAIQGLRTLSQPRQGELRCSLTTLTPPSRGEPRFPPATAGQYRVSVRRRRQRDSPHFAGDKHAAGERRRRRCLARAGLRRVRRNHLLVWTGNAHPRRANSDRVLLGASELHQSVANL